MRITLDELRQKTDLAIDLLEIFSLEGQQYMARLLIDDDYYLLSDSNGKTRLYRSSWSIQEELRSLPVASTDVVHPSAYHEMVGMESSQVEPMRIKVQGRNS